MAQNGNRRPPLVADKRYAKPQKTRKKPTKGPSGKPPRKTRKSAKRKPRRNLPLILALPIGLVRWVFRIVFRLGFVTAIIAVLGLGAAVWYTSTTIPPLNQLVDGRAKGSVTMLDRYGNTYAWRGNQFGGLVTAETVSPHLKNAVVATEDRRFYRHFGVSPRGIASAIRINMAEGRGPLEGHGGSTITQQTAKLLCLGTPYDSSSGMTEAEYEADCRRSSLARKAKEAIYAMALELKFSKDDILTIYLNRAYFGGGSYGAEAAAGRYYGISSAELSPAESATLAGLLTAPSTYSPTSSMDRSWARALTVLKLMEQQGYLSEADAEYSRANPAQLSEAAERKAGGYFADWVMGEGPSFLTRDTTEDVIIKTTFDQKIQTAAEEALAHIFETKVSEGSEAQAAIVVMSADGAVRAMVGGRKTKVSGAFNRATQAMRQTGSAFKPFIYAAALDLGWSYADVIVDEPITINVPGSGPWSPQNYTRKYYGPVTLTTALQNSLNIPAVKLSEDVGRENVRTVASYFGIESDLAAGPALALGVSETTLLQMTGAFAGILNGGSAVVPYGLTELSLLGESQPLMEQEGGIGKRVIQTAANEQLVYMMNQVIEAGSGQRAKLSDREAAGKTGTTQSARDAWFVGFTADYVAGVWMGYDDNTPLKGVTGGGLPAEIWKEVMERVHADLPPRPLPMIRPEVAPVVVQDTPAETFNPGNIFNGGNNNNRPREDSLIGVIQNILGIN
ncbi:1A family penicillin-binding protein [Maritimibacter alkaliphilus HTCC2654]|uniref:peptidoglycan glycosyltransferase n=1 Tax=Maritimibacter alkaliphilus HTCC2654 TaxID=314271 RepID=A3VF41_9RHOB|nr:PBP1A family penicillin-binding protein [Maritimibacter alkaliphilus]EAQ12956.1 Glycosyl transferase, family 51 [Rhodobacterales bacterium HTCC2654] [Maritimibacter alkaliphilus HTCC2654]TYP85052.1 1A family penicillin-binding protein [Maritimibacter alkaliphilus HTCC2654]